MEHFHSSKSNDIDSRAAFPDSITPKERIRAKVRPPLSSLYTVHYSAVNAYDTELEKPNKHFYVQLVGQGRRKRPEGRQR